MMSFGTRNPERTSRGIKIERNPGGRMSDVLKGARRGGPPLQGHDAPLLQRAMCCRDILASRVIVNNPNGNPIRYSALLNL
jgi:hypothetical protein